jgi:hypothetical protein
MHMPLAGGYLVPCCGKVALSCSSTCSSIKLPALYHFPPPQLIAGNINPKVHADMEPCSLPLMGIWPLCFALLTG